MRRKADLGRALLLAVSLAAAMPAAAHRLSAVTHGDSDVTTLPSVDFVEAHGEIGIAGPAANYVVGDAQYANQFTFNGGVTFRF